MILFAFLILLLLDSDRLRVLYEVAALYEVTGLFSPNGPKAPVVDIGYARYQGVYNATNNVTRYLGMRFAQPPTGELRFRAPRSPSKMHGLQQANSQPPSCIQADTAGRAPINPYRNSSNPQRPSLQMSDDDDSESEDCLFINVYHPGPTSPSDLPVMVYIHGGGYTQASMSLFDGQDLVVESNHGVVSVLMQYRLGLFGFLAGQDVKDGGDLNVGLLDQQFALRWVQDNIQKFGGDPSKVTIWGTSAGAGSVLQHVVANGGMTTPPLFRAAIASSTFFPSQYSYDDRVSKGIYNNVVSLANCSSSPDRLHCLRKVDLNALQSINSAVNNAAFYGTYLMVPVVDGEFIRENPIKALKDGKVNGEYMLSLSNSFEGLNFVNSSTANTVDVSSFAMQLFPKLESQDASTVIRQYSGLGTPMEQVVAIMTEAIFQCPGYFALTGFNQNSGFKRAYHSMYAVPPGRHGDDLPYYFTTGWTRTFPNTVFTRTFSEVFMSFSVSSDPGKKIETSSILPTWTSWNWDLNRREMLFNKTTGDVPVIHEVEANDGLLERCRLWDTLAHAIGQA